jgi:hypothetical protein
VVPRVLLVGVSILTAGAISQQGGAAWIDDTPSCKTCKIIPREILRLGDSAGPGVLGANTVLAVDAKRRFFATTGRNSGRIVQFDSDGVYLRDISRTGTGFGEYVLPLAIVPVGDTLYVADGGTSKISQYGPPDLRFARRLIAPAVPWAVIPVGGGRMIVSGPGKTSRQPLHLIDSMGEVIRSYGITSPVTDPKRAMENIRIVGPGAGSNVWVAGHTNYEMELWDTAGKRTRIITRKSGWFPANLVRDAEAPFRKPPMPQVIAVRQQGNLLWVISWVAAEDWKPFENMGRRSGDEPLTDALASRFHDSVVEVFDLDQGLLLASQRFYETFSQFIGDGMVASYIGDEAGHQKYIVWSLELQR